MLVVVLKYIKMKKVVAITSLEVNCNCPNCGNWMNILQEDSVRESLGRDLSAENCNIEITCDECEKDFLVTDIEY